MKISTPQPPTSLEEFFTQAKNEIILGHQNSQQRTLAAFNSVGQQLQQVMKLLSQKEEEIKQFNEFCLKNKIDYPPKPTVITPPKPQSLPPNIKK